MVLAWFDVRQSATEEQARAFIKANHAPAPGAEARAAKQAAPVTREHAAALGAEGWAAGVVNRRVQRCQPCGCRTLVLAIVRE
mmetsp:Transcript_92807/g.262487  ORF Transcript_92807/g.262487 Transcript_92807/m.262487 type:complete len:83 (+) Transcript_92807:1071-1319(+)